jgi:hypothetical protein
LEALAAYIAARFNIGLALFHSQQTFGAIFVANSTAAAFLDIDHYFESRYFIHTIS